MRESLVLLSVLLFQSLYLSVADPSAACPSTNEAQVTFITDDEDCSVFYQCQWGVAYKHNCPAGLHFDSIINVCDYPELANCEGNETNGGDTSEEINASVEESNENDANVDIENNAEDSNAVGECPEVDGEYVTLLPHSSDCTKFFICNEGTPVLTECPDNLLFNPKLLVCDYPESAGCGGDSNIDDNSNGNIGDVSEEQNNETNGNDDTDAEDGSPVGECPEVDGEYVTLLPHSSDCTKFFICNEGTPVLAECPGNLLFNPKLLVCDYPESAGCGGDSNIDDNSNGNIGDVSEEQNNETNGNDDTDAEDGSPVGECPEVDGEYVTLLPHSSDCTKFFICNEGSPVLAECSSNLFFNPHLLVCDYPENAGCGGNSNNEDKSNGSDDGNEEQSTENIAEDDNAVGECPEVDGEYVTLLPHSSDCTKFFICYEGNPVVTNCPSGLLFNPNLLVCDYAENAGCQN